MFIDTAPTMWVVVQEAIRAATLVLIPARPGFFDLDAVRETVKTARERDKPYAVVLNAAPAKRDEQGVAGDGAVARLPRAATAVPVWPGQISQRAGYSLTLAAGASACELAPETLPPPPRSRGCGRRSSARSRRSTRPTRAPRRHPFSRPRGRRRSGSCAGVRRRGRRRARRPRTPTRAPTSHSS